jgi:hypothetical protein
MLYPGRSRVPDAAAPDLRARSFSIAADVLLPCTGQGVLLSHGDSNGGYSLRLSDGHLVHDYVHAGRHSVTRSRTAVPEGRWTRVEVRVQRVGEAGAVQLLVDGVSVGEGMIPALARARTGYTGVDVGCDRGLTVGDYPQPARFTGQLKRIDIEAAEDQWLDEEAILEIEGSTG